MSSYPQSPSFAYPGAYPFPPQSPIYQNPPAFSAQYSPHQGYPQNFFPQSYGQVSPAYSQQHHQQVHQQQFSQQQQQQQQQQQYPPPHHQFSSQHHHQFSPQQQPQFTPSQQPQFTPSQQPQFTPSQQQQQFQLYQSPSIPTQTKDVEVASEQDEAVAEEKKRLSQLAAQKKKMAARPKIAVQRSTTSNQSKAGAAKQAVELFKLDSSDEEQETDMSRFHGKTKASLQSVAKPSIPEAPLEPQPSSEPSAAAVAGPPTDPEVLTAIHNLAAFVNKQGEQFEAMVRERNEAKFKFLDEPESEAYRYYRQCLDKLNQPAAPSLPLEDSDDEDEHSLVGKTVEVLGVQSKPELNGQRGIVESFNDDTGRYVVKLRDLSIALKPTNMKKVDPNDPSYVPPTPAGPSVPNLPPIKPIMSKQKAAAAAVITRLNAKLPSSSPPLSSSFTSEPSSESSSSSRRSKFSESSSSSSKASRWSDVPGAPSESESGKHSRRPPTDSPSIPEFQASSSSRTSSTNSSSQPEEEAKRSRWSTMPSEQEPKPSRWSSAPSTSSDSPYPLSSSASDLSENSGWSTSIDESKTKASSSSFPQTSEAPFSGVRILPPLNTNQEGSDDDEATSQDAYSTTSEGFSEVKRTRKRRSRFDQMPPAAPAPAPDVDGVPLLGTKASGYADSLSQMNAYFNQVCETEKNKLGNEMESIREGGEKHHIGDYLPKDALAKFNAKIAGGEVVDNTNKLTAQNKGYGLLAKMGWTEGAGLGKNSTGIANPIQAAGGVAGAGIGANRDHVELTPGDDAFGAYKKKMALSYRYRPNPLGNPRKAYWEDTGMNAGATQKLSAVPDPSLTPSIN